MLKCIVNKINYLHPHESNPIDNLVSNTIHLNYIIVYTAKVNYVISNKKLKHKHKQNVWVFMILRNKTFFKNMLCFLLQK